MQPPAIETYPAVSVFYLSVPVSGDTLLGTQVVEVAFIADGGPPTVSTTWIAAAWTGNDVPVANPDGTTTHTRPCQVLVGSGTAVLSPGLYSVYARVHADPELPDVLSGLIKIV